MDAFANAILGLIFLGLSFASTMLMFKLWGYPFDKEKLQSEAPRGLMRLHRFLGYAYLIIYVYLMVQMVPRMWQYQVELPARTVAHLTLGIGIGVLIIVKISIVRFFKHLESQLIPFLGTMLLLFTTLLIGLSVPFALRAEFLDKSAVGGTAFSEENIDRLKALLPRAKLPTDARTDLIASPAGLQHGRKVLMTKCVQCHDLRTVLIKPRTPENWYNTVLRMSERPILIDPISPPEQQFVTAYLIAISPNLQSSAKLMRIQESSQKKSEAVAREISLPETAAFDMEEAEEAFEDLCSSCHTLDNVDETPPGTVDEVRDLLERMVENGLDAEEEDLELIAHYLVNTYIQK